MSVLAQTGTTGEHLYLLAEIPVDYRGHRGGGGFGLYLYALDSSHTLKLIREIVPAPDPTHPGDFGDSVYAVRDDMGDKVYVAYPNIIPSTVSVIHKERPASIDEVSFNPEHLTVLNTDFGIAAGDGRQSYLLCTLLPGSPNYRGSLVGVAGDAPAKGARVRPADWTMFSTFRYQGWPGGPWPQTATLGYIKDNHVRIQAEGGVGPFSMPVDLDVIPPFQLETGGANLDVIVAANPRYFAFVPLIRYPGPAIAAPYVCVHDRKRNTWKRLTSASTVAYTRRIFGSWLATIVEVWHLGETVENPGTENGERIVSIPGILVLDNLEDGRRIILNTRQADSEILDVRADGLVLYRVTDSIFSARIAGDQLTKPTLVVRDDEVPEVHWVFWSSAQTNVH
jgi:hypothetical protein